MALWPDRELVPDLDDDFRVNLSSHDHSRFGFRKIMTVLEVLA